MMQPLTLLVLALLAAQGVIFLVGGIVLLRPAGAASPEQQDMLWRGISGRGRIGMGVGILIAAGAALLLTLLLPPGPLPPPELLGIALAVLLFALGMVVGSGLGLAVKTAPKGAAAPGLLLPTGRMRDYRWRRLALLPGALLLGDVVLIGLLDLLFLPRLTPVEVWTLGIFPGVLLLLCAAGEGLMRRLARVPLPPCSPDATLAQRGDVRLRARMIGLLLEREVYALFLLVVCQWLLRAFSPAHPGGLVYNGLPLVYAVVLFSLRGLLEQEQRHLGSEPAKSSATALPS